MGIFDKKKRVIEVGGKKIELEHKPSILDIFKRKKETPKTAAPKMGIQIPTVAPQKSMPQQPQPKPPQQKPVTGLVFNERPLTPEQPKPTPKTPAPEKPARAAPWIEIPKLIIPKVNEPKPMQRTPMGPMQTPGSKPNAGPKSKSSLSFIDSYLAKTLARQKALPAALSDVGIPGTTEQFVRRMFNAAIILAGALGLVAILFFTILQLPLIESIIFGVLMGVGLFNFVFRILLQYPVARKSQNSKVIERDVPFAARDMIISLRSGMPLFDAIKAASSGYGDASKEFAKIVERAQFRVPLEEAIDMTIAESKSPSFRKIMLQASVSIRAGADVVSALQAVIDQISQERVIELRAYGQRLNALAMFYMLFGVILPSMGIAVLAILTTFIDIIPVNTTLLALVLVFIFFIQVIFLKIIAATRPVFAS